MTTRLEKAEAEFADACLALDLCRKEIEDAKSAENAEDWGTVSLRSVISIAEDTLTEFDQDNYPRARDYLTGIISSLKSMRNKK